ncbi:MAG TPA: hypothetical protein VI932_07620 [Bacteroidota bacterium]|nr:hypothetical protein [Bacteroidota bacterium]
MWTRPPFVYRPDEYESEKASNSYLMSVIAVMAGLPFPVINLVATAFFFSANRGGTFFVRWHCTQALVSQAAMLAMNAPGVYWTLAIIFGSASVSNLYISYILTIVIFNILEFIATIAAAIETRKGRHVQWWVFGAMTNALVKQ